MAGPPEPTRLKTATDLLRWLERGISPRLSDVTEAIAHGGTALTLLGIKDSTKDVDFAFRTQDQFDAFRRVVELLGFRGTLDSKATPSEVLHRYENRASVIDLVDLRFPTWNNWRLTKTILRNAVVIPLGNIRLIRPDRDAVFLFKTYPLRDTDLDDLSTVLSKSPPDEDRVIALFDEQDVIHRSELLTETVHEPLI